MTSYNLNLLSYSEKLRLAELLREQERRKSRRKLYTYFPDTGPLRRELYQKHLEFFRAGALHKERLMLAANRIGKTESVGGYELTLHLTGLYPEWWEGWRFNGPISAWMAGKTNETTRDILQAKLFGRVAHDGPRKILDGTGLIPGDHIGEVTWRQGFADLLDTAKVKHKAGGFSRLGVKSYQQGRGSFEGTEQDAILLDEEPPLDIYGECLIRTMTTDGLIMVTFTPLEGMSETVMSFLPDGKLPEYAQ
jgi:phage terminase large subunit-like protein